MNMKKATGNSKRELKRIMADLQKADIKEPGVVILEDIDFYWSKKEMAVFLARWLQGQNIVTIAYALRPHLAPSDAVDEVTLLAFHLRRQKKIAYTISMQNECGR